MIGWDAGIEGCPIVGVRKTGVGGYGDDDSVADERFSFDDVLNIAGFNAKTADERSVSGAKPFELGVTENERSEFNAVERIEKAKAFELRGESLNVS